MKDVQAKPGMESTLKSMDTEEFIDIHFYRPLGYCWALLFSRWGMSPNTVTVIGIFIGLAAGICFYFSSLPVNVAGMLLLIWANMYDSADGQLARMTGRKTPLGRILDGACGDLWFVAIYAALCFRLMPSWGYWIWLLAAVTGFCHTRQAAMADYYRNIHLWFLKGQAGSELEDAAALRDEYRRMTWKRDGVMKFFALSYLQYTAGQEGWAPNFRRMRAQLRQKYRDTAIPESFRTAFREKSLPLMKYTNMLSFNTRIIALFIALFINIPWLYFAFELTALNVMLAYMVITHERFCATFGEQLVSC
ncbi:MAG: CDP-alcohol phosphatidyltransferase family protein [Tannerella sp.]|jgi:hypothetical protein|nr:CDP-alcohol phosphatidyltransferase family protein [Tannerella sp.]